MCLNTNNCTCFENDTIKETREYKSESFADLECLISARTGDRAFVIETRKSYRLIGGK